MLESAVAQYKASQRLQAQAALKARRAWAQVQVGLISQSWEVVLRNSGLIAAVGAAQLANATAGASYSADSLAQQGLYEAPEAFVNPAGFAGVAADGRSLDGLLYSTAPYVKNLIKSGHAPDVAMRAGSKHIEMLTKTTVADAGRGAASVDIASRRGVGYVRMLNPPSCSRCSVLAGKFYRWNAGFQRHPSCFPAGVTVSGPKLEASSRRWYEGELVTLTTATGENLSLTANHPVLTSRGWIPANLIQEGDDVFRSTRTEGATALVVPDHDQVPALVEDVWSSFSVHGLDRVPTTTEDFHGDGQDGEVDVVYADSALRDRVHASLGEQGVEKFLPGGFELALGFQGESLAVLFDGRLASHSGGPVGGGSLLLPFSGGHGRVASLSGFTHGSAFNSSVSEPLGDHSTRHPVLLGEGVFASSGFVGGDDLGIRDLPFASRWDAPALPFSVETRDGYASRGRDLVERLVGQVEADRVVKLSRSHFVGHVYSPSSSEGWLSANNLIVSNCDCIHVASTDKAVNGGKSEGLIHDPYEYFKGLSDAEQDRLYTKAGAQAIRDGADLFQVVNSRRGMSYAGAAKDGSRRGQRIVDARTSEGTSRRGNFGRATRLTPDAIYAQNLSRAETLKQLEHYGYILPGGQDPLGSIIGQREGLGALARGGERVGAREAVLEARRTGVRKPNDRYTMTEAERRLFDAQLRWDAVREGRNPYSSKEKLTPEIAAKVEKDFRRWLSTGGQVFN